MKNKTMLYMLQLEMFLLSYELVPPSTTRVAPFTQFPVDFDQVLEHWRTIVNLFCNPSERLRVVICTVAFGMRLPECMSVNPLRTGRKFRRIRLTNRQAEFTVVMMKNRALLPCFGKSEINSTLPNQ